MDRIHIEIDTTNTGGCNWVGAPCYFGYYADPNGDIVTRAGDVAAVDPVALFYSSKLGKYIPYYSATKYIPSNVSLQTAGNYSVTPIDDCYNLGPWLSPLQAGNISWMGTFAFKIETGSTSVYTPKYILSYDGPQSRYFGKGGENSPGQNIYMCGRLFAQITNEFTPVLGASIVETVDGLTGKLTQTLWVITGVNFTSYTVGLRVFGSYTGYTIQSVDVTKIGSPTTIPWVVQANIDVTNFTDSMGSGHNRIEYDFLGPNWFFSPDGKTAVAVRFTCQNTFDGTNYKPNLIDPRQSVVSLNMETLAMTFEEEVGSAPSTTSGDDEGSSTTSTDVPPDPVPDGTYTTVDTSNDTSNISYTSTSDLFPLAADFGYDGGLLVQRMRATMNNAYTWTSNQVSTTSTTYAGGFPLSDTATVVGTDDSTLDNDVKLDLVGPVGIIGFLENTASGSFGAVHTDSGGGPGTVSYSGGLTYELQKFEIKWMDLRTGDIIYAKSTLDFSGSFLNYDGLTPGGGPYVRPDFTPTVDYISDFVTYDGTPSATYTLSAMGADILSESDIGFWNSTSAPIGAAFTRNGFHVGLPHPYSFPFSTDSTDSTRWPELVANDGVAFYESTVSGIILAPVGFYKGDAQGACQFDSSKMYTIQTLDGESLTDPLYFDGFTQEDLGSLTVGATAPDTSFTKNVRII